MKILITCVGRRVELVQEFYRASKELNIELKIYGTDADLTAPALSFCDEKVLAPKIRSDEYIPFLLDFCKTEKIDGVIPTIDTDLLILAENKSQFEQLGTKVFVAGISEIAVCRDKRKTADYFKNLGLSSPFAVDDILKYDGGFPAFIKPKDGSSSINAFKVDTFEQLKTYSDRIDGYIVQPFVSGTEYTVDIFCDYLGNPIFITPRVRLAVRAGEVLKTQIKNDKSIVDEMLTLIKAFKPSGPMTVQLIKDDKTGVNHYIEINPRFGGGAPLSIKAGADSVKALLKVLNGEKVSYEPFIAEDGAIFCRFDQSVRVK
ncbi:MAG: ATP-grasp domain-containing protein [Clostridia bacterium]|nr:ATP-grasp domain-containing protein [Clostridia bacterium]